MVDEAKLYTTYQVVTLVSCASSKAMMDAGRDREKAFSILGLIFSWLLAVVP